jgi:trimeric autotransporter adhesin
MAERILGPTGGRRRAKRLTLMLSVAGLIVIVGLLITGGSVFAAKPTTTTVNDYSQCANGKPNAGNDPTTCNQGWINGILNANNSQYHEDQVTPQRLALNIPAGAPTTQSVTLQYLARKGQGGVGNHAYDSFATWNLTVTGADRCNPPLAQGSCPGGTPNYHLIPLDPTVVRDSAGAGSATSGHMISDNGNGCDGTGDCGSTSGPRRMLLFGGTITNISVPTHDNPSGAGDDFASMVVTFTVDTSVARDVELLFGGHLAASIGPRGWGTTVGSSFINGGPYHIKLDKVNATSIGNRDNQITSGAILPQSTGVTTSLTQADANGDAVSGGATGANISLIPGTFVKDTATVLPSDSTGTVAFRYYFASTLAAAQAACTADTDFAGSDGQDAGSGIALSATGTADSTNVGPLVTGFYVWRAKFTGTGLSLSSDSGCTSEAVTVAKTTPGITTAPKLRPQDTAQVSGITSGGTGTMSLTFTLYAPSNSTCNEANGHVYQESVTVTGNGPYATNNQNYDLTSSSATGVYRWKVDFTGDSANNDVTGSCGAESFDLGSGGIVDKTS